MFVLAPFGSLTLRMQGYAVGPGRGETRRRVLELSIFLREQDVPGEGDFIGPQVGTMLHARRVGWSFTSGKES